MPKRRALRALLLVCVALGACEPADDRAGSAAESGTLTGTVFYRERMALPASATVEVRLEDVSIADAQAEVLAEQIIEANGRQVPIAFELSYDPQEIEPNRRYAVRASIRGPDDELLFTTTEHYAVLAPGAPRADVELLLERVGDRASTGSITGAPWRLVGIERPGAPEESVASESEYTIEFAADGQYAGQADCNRFTGGYERSQPDRITMRGGAATLAACPEPSIGDEFLRALSAATQYTVRGDELVLSSDGGMGLRFRRDGAQSDAAAAPEVGRTFVFDCEGGVRFTVRTGPGELALWAPESLGGQYMVLGMAQSEQGARYEDGRNVFVHDGDRATAQIADQTFADCRANPGEVPWADAKRRGVTFRAVGNEPSWLIEIHPERLVLVTDLGASRTELPSAGEPVAEGRKTTYRASGDGDEMIAVVERLTCTDTMSGEAFEASATVMFDGMEWRGCGRFL